MWEYGQYCPVAHAVEILGDRWTLLIVRDLMLGVHHFNDLERGLPGISRTILSKRLKQLQARGIIEKKTPGTGRQSTAYYLTEAGKELEQVILALLAWGTKWAFDDPSPEELNPVLLMWWLHRNVNKEQLPEERVIAQFDFYGVNCYGEEQMTFWLILSREDVTLCITDPGFEVNLIITAELATFYKLWAGRIKYPDALASQKVHVEGVPSLTRAFPRWFAWNDYAAVVNSQLVAQPATA